MGKASWAGANPAFIVDALREKPSSPRAMKLGSETESSGCELSLQIV